MIPMRLPAAAPIAGLALLILAHAAPASSQRSPGTTRPAGAIATWQGEGPANQKHALPLREASVKLTPALYRTALDSKTRSDKHRKRDANRKPAEVLSFFGIAPGMTVLDVNAAGGYYTEILAAVVGAEGKVWSQNTQYGLDNWSGTDFNAMLERNAEQPIAPLVCHPTKIAYALIEKGVAPESLDAAIIIRNYHDWPGMGVDRAAFNSAVFKALKPGAVFGVVDHHALPGTGLANCQDLHRIDPETVIEELTAAGFQLEDESDCLANPDDSHDWFIWKDEGAYSDTTDRFVFRFQKPFSAAGADRPGSSE